jgi:ATP:corrinoid adenosyltransferase
MRTYLYTGTEKAEAVQKLVISLAGMRQPLLLARFGMGGGDDLLALLGGTLPMDIVRIRLPGLDWPLSHTPADQVAVRAAMAGLGQMIAGGTYCLAMLDGIHECIACEALDEIELERLVGSASDRTQIAIT